MDAPDYDHRPEDTPYECALAALDDPDQCGHGPADLAHGRRAVRALQQSVAEFHDEAIGWKGLADEYAAALLDLAGVDPADPTRADPLRAAEQVRLRLDGKVCP